MGSTRAHWARGITHGSALVQAGARARERAGRAPQYGNGEQVTWAGPSNSMIEHRGQALPLLRAWGTVGWTSEAVGRGPEVQLQVSQRQNQVTQRK